MLGKRGYYSEHKVLVQKKKKLEYFLRGIVVLFGIGLLWIMIKPLVYDDIQFARQGLAYAKNVDGSLAADNNTVRGMYFLYQGLVIKKDGQQAGGCLLGCFFYSFCIFRKKISLYHCAKKRCCFGFRGCDALTWCWSI